jgi:hypothetical protein
VSRVPGLGGGGERGTVWVLGSVLILVVCAIGVEGVGDHLSLDWTMGNAGNVGALVGYFERSWLSAVVLFGE